MEWTPTSRVEDIIYHLGPDSSFRIMHELDTYENFHGGRWYLDHMDPDGPYMIQIDFHPDGYGYILTLHLPHPMSLPTKLAINKVQLQIDNRKLSIPNCRFQIANSKLPISHCL